MRVLLLGATGHIGQAIARQLIADGFEIHGLARRACHTTRSLDRVTWHFGDLNHMTAAASWLSLTAGIKAVVNAAGVLQDGLSDSLEATHALSVSALLAACPPDTLFVQISAPGASLTAPTGFQRSKARGDKAIRDSGLPWVILRPCIVVSAEAYGGTALLRALAAFPGFIPVSNPQALIQTVALDDVTKAVSHALAGQIPPGSDMVLAEAKPEPLWKVLSRFRQWLGLTEAPVLALPAVMTRSVSVLADVAGYLGWRSPLRSTAMVVAAGNVTGVSALPCRSLAEQLSLMPATVQERWFARAYLLKPVAILVLSLFWLISGVVGLAQLDDAAAHLVENGFGDAPAALLVVAGACLNIALAVLVVIRRTMPSALLGMIGLTAAYLVSATVFTPSLWLDPLGPLVKPVPAAMLALLLLAIEPER